MTRSFDLVREAVLSNGDALFHAYVKVPRHVSKKNSRPIKRNRRTWKPFIGKSPELMRAEAQLIESFRIQILRTKGFKSIDKPLWAVFWFFFPPDEFVVKKGPRKGKLSQRLPDQSNLYELPQDCLQQAGVIENDCLICSHDLSRRLPGKEYALEVFLFEYQMEDDEKPTLRVVE